MKWDESHDSPDVVDNRGRGGGGIGIGALLTFVPFLIRSPIGWVILLAGGAFWFFGGLGGGGGAADPAAPAPGPRAHGAQGDTRVADPDARRVHFVSYVLDDVQAVWTKEFAARNQTYRHAKLVLFTDSTPTGCGSGSASTGPFYCPTDERAYIDLGFYKELADRFGARGEFAQAYVIAHEIGHHVQKLLGTTDRVAHQHQPAQGASGSSVHIELQADCYAGIWAHSTEQRHLLDQGDLESAVTAASAIGDDRLQRRASGTVSPDHFTHGSSEQRTRWLKRGYEQGKIEACDTFAAPQL